MRFLVFCVLAFQSLLALGFTNPIKATDGSDPFMVYHEGSYYLTTTTWNNIQITRASTIQGLKTATPKVVWTDSTASRCCNLWAPEIHWFNNSWYIYYSAGTTGTFDNQHIHVLKGSSNIIGDSQWTYAGRIAIPNRDVWAIDATLMFLSSGTYLVYSSWDGANQCLWISKMTSATQVGNTVKISTPTFDWEKVGANVNEGPEAIYGPTGRTFIVYSASNCAGTGYKLGLLELTGSDPLNSASWTKFSNPVFTSANGVWQPGHNGLFTSPNGKDVFHANSVTPGTCDGNRYTAVQKVNWNSDGSPNFGSPLALGTSIAEPA
ncbi:Arabinanase/levansucrase/invertase [Dendrothele bispora CBS 962.96]|uniref:Arabinanase/levansucrase/invertase n=1 Tax=Dendrothele bispora (strain CBS 962.96) TaxID=1314807 RepID=A0A4V4HIT8_DENBC|nr:Arabinanase/levansucrase/invertase [Dendrothele bispora CBS 962.96]